MIDHDDPATTDVAALLGSDGPFAREVPSFAPREAQQRIVIRGVHNGRSGGGQAAAGSEGSSMSLWYRFRCSIATLYHVVLRPKR